MGQKEKLKKMRKNNRLIVEKIIVKLKREKEKQQGETIEKEE